MPGEEGTLVQVVTNAYFRILFHIVVTNSFEFKATLKKEISPTITVTSERVDALGHSLLKLD